MNPTRLPPGGTGEDLPVELLDAPTATHKSMRQPVQQLGVAWNLTAQTKIVRTADQSVAKVSLPNSVDQHPRREWMVGAGQPLCQFQSPAL